MKIFVTLGLLFFFSTPCTAQESFTLIRNVAVIDVTDGTIAENRSVLIRNDRIVEIGSADRIENREGYQVIEGENRYLIPGLWDMHTHPGWSRRVMRDIASYGVTGIRIMNGDPYLVNLRDQIRDGITVGPTLVVAGRTLEGPVPEAYREVREIGNKRVIETADEAASIVETYARDDFDFIKVYSLLDKTVLDTIVAKAAVRDMQVTGHVPHAITLEEAARILDSIEHLGGFEDYFHRTGGMLGGSEPGTDFRSRSLALQHVDTTARYSIFSQLSAENVYSVPTQIVNIYTLPEEEAMALLNSHNAGHMGGFLKNRTNITWLSNFSEEDFEQGMKTYRVRQWIIRQLRDAGAPMLTGTDTRPYGRTLHWELQELVKAGLTELEALQSATIRPAEFLGIDETAGSIHAGKSADMLLLNRNPLEEISNTQEIEGVFLKGVYRNREDYAELLPDHKQFVGDLINREFGEHGKDAARSMLDHLMETRPDSVIIDEIGLRSQVYWDYLEEQKTEQAFQIAEWMVEYYPASPEAHATLGWLHMNENRPDLAESHYQVAIQLAEDQRYWKLERYRQILAGLKSD